MLGVTQSAVNLSSVMDPYHGDGNQRVNESASYRSPRLIEFSIRAHKKERKKALLYPISRVPFRFSRRVACSQEPACRCKGTYQ
jgi:hypothetical protein